MKMKEQNAYLAAAGFVQVLFIGAAGAFASEMFKSGGNSSLMVAASLLAAPTSIVIFTIYFKVFTDFRRKK